MLSLIEMILALMDSFKLHSSTRTYDLVIYVRFG